MPSHDYSVHRSPKLTDLTRNFLLIVSFSERQLQKILFSAISIRSVTQIFMKQNYYCHCCYCGSVLSGRRPIGTRPIGLRAFRFNLISRFKNCYYKPICLLPYFEICCERQKESGKNLKCDFPALVWRAAILIPGG